MNLEMGLLLTKMILKMRRKGLRKPNKFQKEIKKIIRRTRMQKMSRVKRNKVQLKTLTKRPNWLLKPLIISHGPIGM